MSSCRTSPGPDGSNRRRCCAVRHRLAAYIRGSGHPVPSAPPRLSLMRWTGHAYVVLARRWRHTSGSDARRSGARTDLAGPRPHRHGRRRWRIRDRRNRAAITSATSAAPPTPAGLASRASRTRGPRATSTHRRRATRAAWLAGRHARAQEAEGEDAEPRRGTRVEGRRIVIVYGKIADTIGGVDRLELGAVDP